MKKRILTLIILLFGISLHGQDPAHYLADTVWLKTGKVIPCKISSIDSINKLMTIQAYDTTGILMYEPVSFELVRTYTIGQKKIQAVEKQPSKYKIDLLDGTRLTGTIISENDSVIVIELQDLGELKIRKDKILGNVKSVLNTAGAILPIPGGLMSVVLAILLRNALTSFVNTL